MTDWLIAGFNLIDEGFGLTLQELMGRRDWILKVSCCFSVAKPLM